MTVAFRQTCLTRWRYGQREKRDPAKTATHNLMDGGELCVPDADDDVETFRHLYARAVCANEPIFVVEQRSRPVYRLFFDIDAHLFQPPEDVCAWHVSVCRYICGTLGELFGDCVAHFRMLYCVAAPKQHRKNQHDCVKYGAHVVVPDLHVDKPMMLRVREAVVQKLQNNFPRAGPTTWADDIDEAVYDSCGLRMLFSHKSARCKCRASERAACDRCGGSGRIDEARPYTPLFWMDSSFVADHAVAVRAGPAADPEAADEPAAKDAAADSARDAEFLRVLELLRASSIRSTRSAPNVRFNAALPSWFEDASGLFGPSPSALGGGARRNGTKRRAPALTLTEGVLDVETSLPDRAVLGAADADKLGAWFEQQVRRGALPKEYRGVRVAPAFSYTQHGTRCHVIGRVDSQYCMNIGRTHATNTVYVHLNLSTGLASMRCYCRCETTEGRRTIVDGRVQMCKQYQSAPIDCSEIGIRLDDASAGAIHPRILRML